MFTKVNHDAIKRMEELQSQGKLTGCDALLILTISRFSWGDGKEKNPCKKSIQQLAEISGRSVVQMRRSIAKLVELKFIKQVYRTNKNGKKRTTISKSQGSKRRKKEKVLRSYYVLTDCGVQCGINVKQKN